MTTSFQFVYYYYYYYILSFLLSQLNNQNGTIEEKNNRFNIYIMKVYSFLFESD